VTSQLSFHGLKRRKKRQFSVLTQNTLNEEKTVSIVNAVPQVEHSNATFKSPNFCMKKKSIKFYKQNLERKVTMR
jgi:hypothetical protein